MVSAADLQRLSRATLDLYSPDLNLGNFTEHGFHFLMALVPCDLINYGDLSPEAGILDVTSDQPSSDWANAVDGFGRCMAKYPLFSFDTTVNGGKPFFRNDFYTAREFRHLDIYQESFRILGINNHAAVHVPSEDSHIRFFALERSGTVSYSERDRCVLEQAQYHLANALRLARARKRHRTDDDPGAFCRLGFTPRESEVAYWLTQGKTNVQIAIIIKARPQTVKTHIASLFNKTGAHSRIELTLHLYEKQHGSRNKRLWHRTARVPWPDNSVLA